MSLRLVICWCVTAHSLGAAQGRLVQLPERVDFNFHIKPILSDRCYNCHGPDEENRQGGFRLDLRDSAYRRGGFGDASDCAGRCRGQRNPARLTSDDPSMRMPPEESKLAGDSRGDCAHP